MSAVNPQLHFLCNTSVKAKHWNKFTSKPSVCVCADRPSLSLSLSFISFQDYLIMFIHHLATIGLISFSYVNNMARVGSLVMCVHDASDFLLEVSDRDQTHNNLIIENEKCFQELQ